MISLLPHVFRLLPFLFGGHRQLALDNVALRQQLAVYKRTMSRPKLRTIDRLFWVGLARAWTGWRQSLVIVTPDTVLRWQHRRFSDYWTQLSRRSTGGRPSVNAEIATLIGKIAAANPLWGAPRIHGSSPSSASTPPSARSPGSCPADVPDPVPRQKSVR
jgi:putative transposase